MSERDPNRAGEAVLNDSPLTPLRGLCAIPSFIVNLFLSSCIVFIVPSVSAEYCSRFDFSSDSKLANGLCKAILLILYWNLAQPGMTTK